MMKNIIRITSLMLVLVMIASAMSSCFLFGGNNSGNNDNNGGNENPDDGNEIPDGGNENPDGGNEIPDGGNENPDGGNETPDDGGNEDPDNGGNSGAQDYTTIFTGKQSVLLIGQSNMAGRGFAEDVEPISDDRITMLNQPNQWVKMQEPIHYDKSAAGVGLAASFAKAFVDTFDCELGLIPAAMGGTSISDWKVGGTYYNDAIARAKEAQKDSEICAILWHQGESNRSNHSTYAEKLQVILDAMIAELGLDADKIVIITGELRETSTSAAQRETFHAQLNKLSEVYKNYGVADAEGLTLNKDIIHFDAPSLRVFGYRYFNIFKTLVTGDAFDFVDDRNHYYVGAEIDPTPNNSGYVDLPSDNPGGGDFGGNDTPTEGRVEIEGNIVADTYLASGTYADDNRAGRDFVGTNKNGSRPLFMYNLSLLLSDPAVQTYRETAKVEFTFTITEGAESITDELSASAYGFLPGEGVSNADFTTLTWNNCKQGKENEALYRGDATFIYKDTALGEVNVVKSGNTITFILDYTDVEQFICTEEGDYYGIAVLGFDFNVGGIKFASMENTTYAIPTVNFVYEVVSTTEG